MDLDLFSLYKTTFFIKKKIFPDNINFSLMIPLG